MSVTHNHRLAVLIDADNAQAAVANELLAEISRYGTASVKRAYGDWTTPHLKGWKELLPKLAIQPIHQFSYTTGKNATDSSLIIDAMDLLHAGGLDGFCLVSSDSDFTQLATRLRQSGMTVYGFGESKTPERFVAACDKFVLTEILRPKSATEIATDPAIVPPLKDILGPAVEATARDNGWSALSAVGAIIGKSHPSFDSRNYGFPKLGQLVREQTFLEVKEVPANDGSGSVHFHVRMKRASPH